MRSNYSPTEKAVELVFEYVSERMEKTDEHVAFTTDDVYLVWFCYILGGWKALVSTTLPNDMYYEVTFDKERQCAYIDAYKKWENVQIDMTN